MLLRLILKSIQILGLGPGQIIFLSFLELSPEINLQQKISITSYYEAPPHMYNTWKCFDWSENNIAGGSDVLNDQQTG